MTNLYNSNSKKISQFQGQSLIQDTDLFTFVRSGTNFNVKWSDLKLDLGVTGALTPIGAPTATPVLKTVGTDYSIRGIETAKGISSSLSAQDGVQMSCNFAQVGGGLELIKNLNASQYEFKTLVGGNNINITDDGNELRFDLSTDIGTSKTVIVSEEADFPTPIGGVIELEPDTDYLIVNDIATTNRFSTTGVNTIRAASSQLVQLTYTGVDAMFTAVEPNFKIIDITIDCPNGDLFDTTAPSGFGIVQMVESNVQTCQSLGNLDGNFITRFTNVAFENLLVGGLSFSGTHRNLVVDVGVSFLYGGSLIDLGSATFSSISIEGGIIEDSAVGTFFLSGLPNSGNVIPGGLATVFNNKGFGNASSLDGITTSDNRWEFTNNNTIPDSINDGLIYTESNALETVISATNTPVKVNGVFTTEDVSRFSADGTGRLTYTGERPSRLPIDVTASAIGASGGDKQATFYIAINGVILTPTGIQETINSSKAGSFSLIWQYEFNPNDYVEVFCENNQDTINIVAQNVVLRVN